jgi:glutamyl-tRNA synthetase
MGLPLVPGGTAVRLAVPPGLTVRVGSHLRPVPSGDHVLWRRDDLPAYHLGSVVVDEDLGVTAVVRGVDLLDSSALQLHLAALLPAPGFGAADLRHHGLITNPDGEKLSKSAGAAGHPMLRTTALRRQVHAWAAGLGARIGIEPAT